jgi:hypothetical protein
VAYLLPFAAVRSRGSATRVPLARTESISGGGRGEPSEKNGDEQRHDDQERRRRCRGSRPAAPQGAGGIGGSFADAQSDGAGRRGAGASRRLSRLLSSGRDLPSETPFRSRIGGKREAGP